MQATEAAKSPQPDQVPDPDAAQRDARLIGRWIYSEYYRSGRFSGSHHQWMVLGGDGGFSGGEDAHGRWSTQGNRLYFFWRDNTYTSYDYEVSGDSLLLSRGGQNRLWRRA